MSKNEQHWFEPTIKVKRAADGTFYIDNVDWFESYKGGQVQDGVAGILVELDFEDPEGGEACAWMDDLFPSLTSAIKAYTPQPAEWPPPMLADGWVWTGYGPPLSPDPTATHGWGIVNPTITKENQ